ncbi:MAG: hypothetical protein LC640_01275 [Frankia sp.]|nr:hypothetical protein [Frankia sp.]
MSIDAAGALEETVPGATLARGAATIAVITVAARVAGLARTVVLAHTVGPSFLGNTYATANTVPNVIFEIVAGGALASAVVPMLAGPLARGDRRQASATASALLSWCVVVLVPVAAVGAVARTAVMHALVGDVSDAAVRAREVALGSRMLLVFMPQVVLYGVGIVLTGVLHAHRRFAAPAIAPLLSSLVVISAYLAFAGQDTGHGLEVSRAAELTLSVGTTAGVAALTLSLLVPTFRLRLRLRPTLHMPPGTASGIRLLAAAGASALVAQQLALVVVLRLANPLPGGVIVYQVAYTVFLLPWAVLAVPIATSAFPRLAAATATGDADTYRATARPAAVGVLVTTSCAAAILIATAAPASRLLLGVQHLPGVAAADELRRAIVTFAPGLPGYGLVALLTRALYARHGARAAAVSTVVGFGVVAVADVVAVFVMPSGWRVAALGVGNTMGMTTAGVLLLLATTRRTPGLWPIASARAVAALPVALLAGVGAGYEASSAVVSDGRGADVLGVVAGAVASVAVGIGVALAAGVLDVAGLRAHARHVVGRRG